MINFDEEIKKFDKSLDIDDFKDTLLSDDITDMNDLMFNLLNNRGV